MEKKIEKILNKYRRFNSDRMAVADALEISEMLNDEMAGLLMDILYNNKLK